MVWVQVLNEHTVFWAFVSGVSLKPPKPSDEVGTIEFEWKTVLKKFLWGTVFQIGAGFFRKVFLYNTNHDMYEYLHNYKNFLKK